MYIVRALNLQTPGHSELTAVTNHVQEGSYGVTDAIKCRLDGVLEATDEGEGGELRKGLKHAAKSILRAGENWVSQLVSTSNHNSNRAVTNDGQNKIISLGRQRLIFGVHAGSY